MKKISALIAIVCLPLCAAAAGADKTVLNCTFPAAKEVQKIKPGAKGVSDGSIRIDPITASYTVCNGCEWEKSGAKWKVDAKQYRMATTSGISIVIDRQDGSAVFKLSSKGDDNYLPAQVESRGKCIATVAKP